MLFSVEKAFEGRDEIPARLKTPTWEATRHSVFLTLSKLMQKALTEYCANGLRFKADDCILLQNQRVWQKSFSKKVEVLS